MSNSLFCRHDIFSNDEPTKEEINIFRLWECPDCHKWLSFVHVTKNDETYNFIKDKIGFSNAYQKVVYNEDGTFSIKEG